MKYCRLWVYLSIVILGVALDLGTKYWIVTTIQGPEDFKEWLPILSIVRTHNTGVSFGMLSTLNLGPWFYGVMIVTIISFLVYMIFSTQRFLSQLSFVFMIAGAVGNLLDRIYRGYVVDFISVHWFHQYHFYVFNIADIFVSCGAGLVVLDLLLENRTSK